MKQKLIKRKKSKGLTAEALAESRKIKSEFLLELGTKKVPTSILIHDRSEVISKTTDSSRKKRGGGYAFHYKKNQRKIYSKKEYTPGIEKSGLKLQGRTGTLSAFPQNIGPIWDDYKNQCKCKDPYKYEVWRVAPIDELLDDLKGWAVSRKEAETGKRPDVNIYKKTLITAWDQIIRKLKEIKNITSQSSGLKKPSC